MVCLGGCSGKPAGESSAEILDALPDPPKLEDCGGLLRTLDWKVVQPGELKTGGVGTAIMSAVDQLGGESTFSSAFNVNGTIKITRPFTITDEGIPASLYCDFLNDVESPTVYLEPEHSGPFSGSGPDWVLHPISFDETTGTYVLVEGREHYSIMEATFEGAAAFCEWLSAKTGCSVRLPTEGEWMLASERLNWGNRSRGLRSTDCSYWVQDYYSPDISYLVRESDPLGPRLGVGAYGYSWDNPHRLVRKLPGVGGNPRRGEPLRGARSRVGFRLVLGAWPEDWKPGASLTR